MVEWDDFLPDLPDDWYENVPPLDDDLPDPEFLGRVNLIPSGELFADIYGTTPSSDFSLRDVSYMGIDELLGIDEGRDQGWADMATELPFGFDQDSPDIRGPFPDEDAVNHFINETGLYWADIYYDDESDSYFIDVSY